MTRIFLFIFITENLKTPVVVKKFEVMKLNLAKKDCNKIQTSQSFSFFCYTPSTSYSNHYLQSFFKKCHGSFTETIFCLHISSYFTSFIFFPCRLSFCAKVTSVKAISLIPSVTPLSKAQISISAF